MQHFGQLCISMRFLRFPFRGLAKFSTSTCYQCPCAPGRCLCRWSFRQPESVCCRTVGGRARTHPWQITWPCPQGHPWPSLAVLGRPWPSLAVLGRPWPSLAVFGRPWPSLAVPGKNDKNRVFSLVLKGFRVLGRPWPSLAVLSRPWPSLAVLSRPWPSLAVLGRPWPSLVASLGRPWPSRAVPGSPMSILGHSSWD